MKLKILFIIFFSLFSLVFIHAQETIVDTIFAAGPPLSGVINNFNYNYVLQVVFTSELLPGDTGMPWIPPYVPNATERAYLSFPLDSLFFNQTANIDSVVLRLAIGEVVGNDNWGEWPVWDVPGGDTIKCCIDHVNFGNYLDVNDWTAGDYGDPQTIISKFTYLNQDDYNPVTFYAHIIVTDAVINDIENERDKTQFRIGFELNTDDDGLYDYIYISRYAPNPQYYPTLFIYSADSTNVVKENVLIANNDICLKSFPNPFNPETTIKYQISKPDYVKLEIINIKGQLVETLVNKYQESGKHSVIWNAENLSSGVYFYKITAGIQTQTGKCLLVK